LGLELPLAPIEPSERQLGADAILLQDGLSDGDPYLALGRFVGLEHTALVGAAVAASQLGLPVILFGPCAWVAGELAARMNTTICPWLRFCPTPRSRLEGLVPGRSERL
jgi:NaMN:DMB phosphoribosyltransferase